MLQCIYVYIQYIQKHGCKESGICGQLPLDERSFSRSVFIASKCCCKNLLHKAGFCLWEICMAIETHHGINLGLSRLLGKSTLYMSHFQ